MYDNSFEKAPGDNAETQAERSVPPEQDFEKSFAAGDIPEFAGEQFGVAN